jgi:glyoxylase-like metal-dependent hydrolase (beta-lactamase superfamily II)
MGGGFIHPFLLPHNEGYILIETGPGSSLFALIEELKGRNLLFQITHIVVTHIHLDHSGGAGELGKILKVPILVHPRGKKHLENPERLIASARRLFGDDLERRWGIPAPAERVVAVEDGEKLKISGETLEFFHTPGHAEHHMAVLSGATGILFTGDVGGVRFLGPESVLPPTAPPQFDPQAWDRSIEILKSLKPKGIALTHGGIFLEPPKLHWEILKERLEKTVETFRTYLLEGRERAWSKTIALWRRWLKEDPKLIARMETIMPFHGCMLGIEIGMETNRE